MGETYVEAVAVGPLGERSLRLLVDSGTGYTVLPDDVWRAIGLEPTRIHEFRLVDGTPMERGVSECRIRLPQGETASPVILGESGDEALLGYVTLENLGLVLDPFARKLQPMHLRLRR
jgi:predicted aspartyl protease